MTSPSFRWNAGRAVGERVAFSIAEAQNIYFKLNERRAWRELCLFALGIDTMLRASDLLQLRVSDIQDGHKKLRARLVLKQQKTRYPVYPVLTYASHFACKMWLQNSGKQKDDFLFTPHRNIHAEPISAGWYRRLVKKWVADIGLPPENYSTHSLRRTKPLYLYHVKHVDIQHISQLLGHHDIQATSHYLRLQISAAQAEAMAADIFQEKKDADKNIIPASASLLARADIEAVATAVAQKISTFFMK